MNIEPNDPVTFQDSRGVTWWGTAVSPVITKNQPWPVVMIRVGTKTVKAPARDVELVRVQPVALRRAA